MSRIAVMMSSNRPEDPMSEHFGKAPWMMFAESLNCARDSILEFAKNDGMNGRSTAMLALVNGCSDVVLVEIGDGALRHLQAAKIRIWTVPAPVSGREALRLFAEGGLSAAPEGSTAIHHGEHHGGCCCSTGTASDAGCCSPRSEAKAGRCCQH